MTLETRRPWAWVRSQTTWFAAACLFFALIDGTASAAPARRVHPDARAVIATPTPLRLAAQRAARADRALVSDAKAAVACARAHRAEPALCAAARKSLQQAGSALSAAERRLASVARAGRPARAAVASSNRRPRLRVSGHRLSWTRVAHVNSYVLVREVPGQASEYSLVNGTSSTPPPVPGVRVTYAVRTAVERSSWSDHKTVTYPWRPAPVTHPTPPTSPPEVTDPQAAPAITVSGETLNWTKVAGVSTYVVVSKVAGKPEAFTSVGGTSLTPPVVAGATVHYSVRTAVDGSAWSSEVAITYPASPPPVPPAPPTEPSPPRESSTPGAGSFQFGINSGTNMTLDVGGAVELGAKIVRIDFAIGETPAQMEPVIAGYAAKGIRVAPLADFDGTLPSPTEARGLASWAKAYGPGGTYWAAHGNGQLAIQTIEFGNETSGGYQYGDNAGEPSYQSRAENYALRLKEAAEAIDASGVDVGVLAVSEDWTGDWMNGMFSAVPNLGSYVAGWVSHPYGTGWKTKIEDIISQAKAHGAPSTIPIDITEWGLATDNGRCLTENYGYNPCMTYKEAAETLHKDVTEMGQLLGARAGLFLIYQVRDQAVSGTSTGREEYFGLLQHELQTKGPYTEAAQELLAG